MDNNWKKADFFFGNDIVRYFFIIDANVSLLLVMMSHDLEISAVVSWDYGDTGFFTETEPVGSL